MKFLLKVDFHEGKAIISMPKIILEIRKHKERRSCVSQIISYSM